LKKHAKGRKGRLEDAKALFQLWEDHEEEEAWLVEKKRICQTGISAKDLRAVLSLQQKHKVRHSFASHLHNISVSNYILTCSYTQPFSFRNFHPLNLHHVIFEDFNFSSFSHNYFHF